MQREKQELIQEALRRGKGYKEIASEFRVSFRDISKVAKDMDSLAPFDVFDRVVEGLTPQDIAEETGAEFDDVRRLYQQCVELLEYVARHEAALKNLRGAGLLARMRVALKEKTGIAEHQQTSESPAKRYACARCGEPLADAPSSERCPKCGHTKYKEV